MKKNYSIIYLLLSFMVLFGCLFKVSTGMGFAETMADTNFASKAAYCIDSESKTCIFSKNETEKLPIASMCKIMTLLLSFEEIDNGNLSLSDDVVVSENASGMGGSQVFLETNGVYKVEELLKSITIASANDSCVAMAEKICGAEDAFVCRMNEKAKELKMDNTLFVNCTGLPKAGQYSCAKDVAEMFSELIKHQDYFKFSTIWMSEIKHPKDRVTEISNTNKLVRFYKGCDCGKTGFTGEAGHCLCASAERNGTRFISVVISAPDSKTRFNEVSEMFNYGFANYQTKTVISKDVLLDMPVKVENGRKDYLEVKPLKSFSVFSEKNTKRNLEIDFIPNASVKAPINEGETVGMINVYENGVQIAEIPVVANETIEKATYFDSVRNVISNWSLCG